MIWWILLRWLWRTSCATRGRTCLRPWSTSRDAGAGACASIRPFGWHLDWTWLNFTSIYSKCQYTIIIIYVYIYSCYIFKLFYILPMRHGQMVYPFLFQAGFQIMRWPFDLGWNIKCPSSRPWLNGNESSRTMTRLCQVSILPIGGSRLDGCGGNFCDIMRCFDKFWWFRRCIIQQIRS